MWSWGDQYVWFIKVSNFSASTIANARSDPMRSELWHWMRNTATATESVQNTLDRLIEAKQLPLVFSIVLCRNEQFLFSWSQILMSTCDRRLVEVSSIIRDNMFFASCSIKRPDTNYRKRAHYDCAPVMRSGRSSHQCWQPPAHWLSTTVWVGGVVNMLTTSHPLMDIYSASWQNQGLILA